jgi:hypothetical protein
MLKGKAWKYLGVGSIGAFVGIVGLIAVFELLLPLFANNPSTQKVSLSAIGCPAGMNEDMSNGRCTMTPQTFTVLSYATEGISGLDILKDKPEPSVVRDFASKVDNDDGLAFKLYHIAAILGDGESQFILGGMYSNGRGTEEDDMESLRWLHESAHSGYRKAQLRLAYMLSVGEFIAKNDVEAVSWLNKAKENQPDVGVKDAGI